VKIELEAIVLFLVFAVVGLGIGVFVVANRVEAVRAECVERHSDHAPSKPYRPRDAGSTGQLGVVK